MNKTILRIACLLLPAIAGAQVPHGYYRYPAIQGHTIVFTAEGDLWTVGIEGGAARRLTTHPAEEIGAAISPDGSTLAFTGNYEGSAEVYTMPITGGLPLRRTYGGGTAAGWTPDGKVIYATNSYAAMPQDWQLATIDAQNRIEVLPLHQAAQGVFDPSGKTLFFTRLRFQGSYAKRYQGGTAQKLWKFTTGQPEAMPLTGDFAGTSRDAMYWKNRVYFVSDRDGTMNLWSMDENGKNLRQHTRHQGWDIQSPRLDEGRVVYQLGADLHLYDIAAGQDQKIEIAIGSDFDQLRERWVKAPLEYTTSIQLAPQGDRIVMTARGRVFVLPVKQGRLVEATEHKPARYRMARLLSDGETLLALSTESGEVELWELPANGAGAGQQITTDGSILRWDAMPSPDGKWIAHTDKEARLWLLNAETKENRLLVTAPNGDDSETSFMGIRWSPDSRWFVFSQFATNTFEQIWLYSVESGQMTALTSDRYNSMNATWSRDGSFIYFLSDRALQSVVGAPWGARQPDPFFDRSNKVYELALRPGVRSPFEPADELHPDKPPAPEPKEAAADKEPETPVIEIELGGIQERLREVPVPPGNYSDLAAAEKRLCWLNRDRSDPDKTTLECVAIQNKGDKPETLMEGVSLLQLSEDGKKILLRKKDEIYVVDSTVSAESMKGPKTLAEGKVILEDWTFSVIPAEEYQDQFLDAWRLHRDYFYDRNMHGLDWAGIRDKYAPLVSRVRDRSELSNLIAQMVSELSVLHSNVRGGDLRAAPDQINVAELGALLERDEAAGGWAVRHIYRTDPDRPDKLSPLARPGVDVKEGDVLLAINGRETITTTHPFELLRDRAGKQVLLRVGAGGDPRDVVVMPVSAADGRDLRYSEWEYTRRLQVEQAGGGEIGYVHLRAMGPNDIAQFAEQYYPVYDRQGLIVDVRHNTGGNIDSWILGKLMRTAWMYLKGRASQPVRNMQYAFHGHMVVLCDEWTGSDGEAFTEGFRRMGLGKIIGTRTWGGAIWLTSSNVLADQGIATAGEYGSYDADGKWLIEGHGVDPDMVVDNLPHATFEGQDAQLEAAIAHLQELIRKQPRAVPSPPAYPDKSFQR